MTISVPFYSRNNPILVEGPVIRNQTYNWYHMGCLYDGFFRLSESMVKLAQFLMSLAYSRYTIDV